MYRTAPILDYKIRIVPSNKLNGMAEKACFTKILCSIQVSLSNREALQLMSRSKSLA